MKISSREIYTAKLINNCPECFGTNGLELHFFQSEMENALYTKASSDITSEMHCSICNTDIFPVRWGEDIERIFEYHRKRVETTPSNIRLKPLAYAIIITDVVLLVLLLIYIL